jgi:hypothetical protein
MPLSNVQKGAIGQFAFLVAALATGKGEVELYTPAADNEGRDTEVRRHLKRAPAIGIQIKVAFRVLRHDLRHKQHYLEIRFDLPEKRVQNDPRLWYFLAFYDQSQLQFLDPVFLVPSHIFHKMARRSKFDGRVLYWMSANMGPNARDKWAPYRVALRDLGKRLLEIIDEVPLRATDAGSGFPSDGLWLSRAVPGGTRSSRMARTDGNYGLIRNAVLKKTSLSAWYKGHARFFSPFVLGTKADDPHVLGYQFDGTSEKPLKPEGSTENWRCFRVAELTSVRALPGIWHAVQKGKRFQHCIDHVDVSAGRPPAGKHQLRRAA